MASAFPMPTWSKSIAQVVAIEKPPTRIAESSGRLPPARGLLLDAVAPAPTMTGVTPRSLRRPRMCASQPDLAEPQDTRPSCQQPASVAYLSALYLPWVKCTSDVGS